MDDSTIIAIVSIVGALSLGAFFFWNLARESMRARELLHIERQAAIAKGLPPPDEPRDKPAEIDGGIGKAGADTAEKALGTGFFWLFVGLGMIVALRIVYPWSPSWGWGVILVALGLAYLVGYGVSVWQARRARKDTAPPTDGSYR